MIDNYARKLCIDRYELPEIDDITEKIKKKSQQKMSQSDTEVLYKHQFAYL